MANVTAQHLAHEVRGRGGKRAGRGEVEEEEDEEKEAEEEEGEEEEEEKPDRGQL